MLSVVFYVCLSDSLAQKVGKDVDEIFRGWTPLFKEELEFGMYPQSMPTEWTHVRTVRAWQSVRLDL